MSHPRDLTELFQPLIDRMWEAKKNNLIAIAIHDSEESLMHAQAGAKTIADAAIAVAVGSTFGSHGPLAEVVGEFEASGRSRKELMRATLEFGGNAPKHVLVRIADGSRYVLTLVYRGDPNAGQRFAIERFCVSMLADELNSVLSKPSIRVP